MASEGGTSQRAMENPARSTSRFIESVSTLNGQEKVRAKPKSIHWSSFGIHVQAMPSLLDPYRRATHTGARSTPRQSIRDPRNSIHKISSFGGASMVASPRRPREASWIRSCNKGQRIEWRKRRPTTTGLARTLVRTISDKLGAHLRESAQVNDFGMKAASNHQKPRRCIEGHGRSRNTKGNFNPAEREPLEPPMKIPPCKIPP